MAYQCDIAVLPVLITIDSLEHGISSHPPKHILGVYAFEALLAPPITTPCKVERGLVGFSAFSPPRWQSVAVRTREEICTSLTGSISDGSWPGKPTLRILSQFRNSDPRASMVQAQRAPVNRKGATNPSLEPIVEPVSKKVILPGVLGGMMTCDDRIQCDAVAMTAFPYKPR
jgi:hypothetical protein